MAGTLAIASGRRSHGGGEAGVWYPPLIRVSSDRWQWAAATAALLVGTGMLHGATVVSGLTRLPGDLGDTRFNLLVLEHGFRSLRGDAFDRDFWSPAFAFWPHPDVLAYSDNLAGDLLGYAPLRAMGLDPARAFALFLLLCTVLDFAATLALGRALGLSVLGASAAATLFAFGMPRSAQLNHAQLLPSFWTPLCFLCAVLSWRRWRAGRAWAARGFAALAAPCAVLQLAAGIYLGVFLLLGAAGVALGLAWHLFRRRERWAELTRFCRSTVAGWAIGGALGLALLWPLLAPYARARAELGGRPLAEVAGMLPRAASYLLPAPGSVPYHGLLRLSAYVPVPWEQALFAGFLPLVALVALAFRGRRRAGMPVDPAVPAAVLGLWWTSALATLFLGSWHGVPLSLWALLRHMPGLDALRAVSRVGVLELLGGGLAAGIVVTGLARRPLLALLLALFPLAENWSRCPAPVTATEMSARVRRVEAAVPPGCRAFFWRGEGAGPAYALQLDAMAASLDLAVPTLNGYSGHDPPRGLPDDPREVSAEDVRRWLAREGMGASGLCVVP